MKFLNMEGFIKELPPVTSTEYLLKTGEFNPEGLFSEEIFGSVGSAGRGKTFSYINLFSEVVHPEAYRILKKLDRRIETLLSTESNYSVDEDGNLYVDEENGSSGILSFKEMLPNISFRGGGQRDKLIEKLRNSHKEGSLFIEYLPIIPPDFRPMYQGDDGEWIIDELNDTYVSIMRKAFQMSNAGSGPLYDLLNYEMQNAILKHDEYIRSKLSKKEGAIRGLTLGKRTDYTGRAVASPGPDFKPSHLGLPFRMAAKMFEPFIIHVLLKTDKIDQDELSKAVQDHLQTEVNVDSVQKILKSIRNNDKLPENLYNIFWEATKLAMYDRVIICKRDPVLHAQSLQGFYPTLVEGDTIQFPTTQISKLNLDFDGDTLAAYHPMTDESQEEVKNKMMSIKSGTSSDEISIEISKEMAVGLYVLTKDYKPKGSPVQIRNEDIDNVTDPTYAAKYKGQKTTAGKAIFNSCLPDNYPFVDGIIDKKRANKIISDLAENYSEDEAKEAINSMKDYGFKFSTIISPTISISQLELPPDLYEKKEKLGNASPEEAADLLSEIQERLKEYLKDTGLGDLVESGSSKGWGQPMQILIAKGIVADPEGNLLQPIKSAFSEGLLPSDYFKASAGARKGIVDRTLNTSSTGYLSRKLVYLLQDVEADPNTYDCKTQRYLTLKLDKETIGRFHGRYHLTKDNKLEVFDKDNFDIGDVIQFRSPIFCRSKKICQTCYGKLLKRHQSQYVGTLAAMSLGERSTQLMLQTFHVGGSVTLTRRNMLKDIIQNDPLIDLEE